MSSNAACLVRPARPSDVDAIVRVHIESTEDAYAPLAKSWPEPDREARRAHWANRLAANESGQRSDFVAELEGSIVGFISGGAARQPGLGCEVEIYVIHVLPQHRGAGIGSQLWSPACERIRGEDLKAMYVGTLGELRCCAFYERHGGVIASRSPAGFHGAAVTDVIYRWPRGCPHEAAPT